MYCRILRSGFSCCLFLFCLAVAFSFAATAFAQDQTRTIYPANPDPQADIYFTGSLFGYFRLPAVQRLPLDDSTGRFCPDMPEPLDEPAPIRGIPVLNGAKEFANQAALASRLSAKDRTSILVGMGNNFSQYYWARVLWDERKKSGVLKDRTDFPRTDNVACFLSYAHYDAIVPGKHDFAFGAERLRQLASFLAFGVDGGEHGHSAGYRPVLMLAANMIIKTTWIKGHEPVPDAEKRQVPNYIHKDSVLSMVIPDDGGSVLPFLRQVVVSASSDVKVVSAICEAQALKGIVDPDSFPLPFNSLLLPPTGTGNLPNGCEQLAPFSGFKGGAQGSNTCASSQPGGKDGGDKAECSFSLPPDYELHPGKNYAVCFSREAISGEKPAGTTGPFCARFSVDLPFISDPRPSGTPPMWTWASAKVPAAGENDDCVYPNPFCLRTLANGTEVVIFGVVDPELQSHVGKLNFGWINSESGYDTTVATTDPMVSLRQAFQFFYARYRALHGPEANFHGLRILLAQMNPSPAREFAYRIPRSIGESFDVVFSDASEMEATPDLRDLQVSCSGQSECKNAPIIITPMPQYDAAADMRPVRLRKLAFCREPSGEVSLSLAFNGQKPEEPAKYETIATQPAFIAQVHQVAGQFSGPSGAGSDTKALLQQITLWALREEHHTDLALMQKRDFYWPPAANKEACQENDNCLWQAWLDMILWKNDFPMTLSVPGSVLKKVLAQSAQFDKDDKNTLSTLAESSRGLVTLGLKSFPDAKTFLINDEPLDENRLYSVATSDYIGFGDTGYPDLLSGAVDAKTGPRDLPDTFRSVSTAVCMILSQSGCEDDLARDRYFDHITTAPSDMRPGVTLGHRFLLASPFWMRKRSVELTGLERKVQQRVYTDFALERFSFGFSSLAHRMNETDLQDVLGGVSQSEVSQPKQHAFDIDQALRYTIAGNTWRWFALQEARFKESFTSVAATPATATQPAVFNPRKPSQIQNRLDAETGVYFNIGLDRSRGAHHFEILLSARAETQFDKTDNFFKVSPGELVFEQPRTYLSVGRLGLRWQKGKNSFELGGQGGGEFGAISAFHFRDPMTKVSVTCTPTSVMPLGSCIKLQKVSRNALTSFDQETRARYGPYWRWDLTMPMSKKISYTARDDGAFFFNAALDNSTDTRFVNTLTHGLKFQVMPNLSFEPQHVYFYYFNKVDRRCYWQNQTQILITFSFDWFSPHYSEEDLRYLRPDRKK